MRLLIIKKINIIYCKIPFSFESSEECKGLNCGRMTFCIGLFVRSCGGLFLKNDLR